MRISRWIVSSVAALLIVTGVAHAQTAPPASQSPAPAQAGQKPDPKADQQQQKPDTYKETVVVSRPPADRERAGDDERDRSEGVGSAPSNNYATSCARCRASTCHSSPRATSTSRAAPPRARRDVAADHPRRPHALSGFLRLHDVGLMPVNLDEISASRSSASRRRRLRERAQWRRQRDHEDAARSRHDVRRLRRISDRRRRPSGGPAGLLRQRIARRP